MSTAPTKIDLRQYCDVAAAADIIGKSESQVYRYIQQGLLPAIETGPLRIVVKISDAKRFVPPRRGNPNWQKKE